MRDVLVTLIVFGSLPYIFKRPYLGAIMWVWISVMNPHTQGWGFARSFPFAALIAGATMLSILVSKERFRLPRHPVTYMFVIFILYMGLTSMFAIHVEQISGQLIKVYKILGMTLVVMMLVHSRREIEGLIWIIMVSIGFYGVKGGIFTVQTGGNFRVWGPEGTFIDGNNEIALALVVVIPLMYYLVSVVSKRWQRLALMASMLLCALASLGSYSRGAALAIGAMTVFLWLKSSHKVPLGIVLAVASPLMLLMMPEQWHSRIDTIDTYEQDASAMGRINAWQMAYRLANDRLLGGGFEIYDEFVFHMYAPNPLDIHAAHSIYFQVLGEHGWGGLLIYLLLGIMTWRCGSWVIRHAKEHPDLHWAINLCTMLQVALLGFAVGGAFLSLTYFDVPYFLMAAMVATRLLVERELKQKTELAATARAIARASAASDRVETRERVPASVAPVTEQGSHVRY